MLFCLGPLAFEVAPLNADEFTRDAGYDYAAKDIMDQQRPREGVGEADEKITLKGKLFPHRFGGLDELTLLDNLRTSGAPQILVRGDGLNFGWYFIEKTNIRHTYLDPQGIGRQIEVAIDLVKSPNAPDAGSLLGQLMSLFG
ncbi:phage tail protein [Methylovirgula sp. 4M-Z18]|uniref:phage tail protein n=1 Tax=Methylovirgula sp. 4M-Z18 TaxID=2293567 RepID=UPI000E2E591C|nr:phage tail protein [Methylovirgula sp. 4M-Z18]RFB80390.1 phage tail protein [Methylovirgula sp. 4M-Z18]